MYDRKNIRTYWNGVKHLKNPITTIDLRLINCTYNQLQPGLFFNPTDGEHGVETTYRNIDRNIRSLHRKLAIIYCGWENTGEKVTDTNIRKLVIGLNYEIYETYLHILKLAAIFLPAVRTHPGIVENFRNTLIDFTYRTSKSFPGEFANGVTLGKKPMGQSESENLRIGAEIPQIDIEREFLFHQGTKFQLDDIEHVLNLRDQMNTEHPSVGRIIEFIHGLETTFTHVDPKEFSTLPEDEVQGILITLLYTFGRWSSHTLTALLKDDQEIQTMYDASGKELSYRHYRDVKITNILNPLIVTTTTIN